MLVLRVCGAYTHSKCCVAIRSERLVLWTGNGHTIQPAHSHLQLLQHPTLLQFALALEAATVQLLDKSLLQAASASASTASTSPVRDKQRRNAAPRPQLLIVGPVGVEVASTRLARKESDRSSGSRPGGDDSGVESGAPQEAPVTPTPTPGAQVRLVEESNFDRTSTGVLPKYSGVSFRRAMFRCSRACPFFGVACFEIVR